MTKNKSMSISNIITKSIMPVVAAAACVFTFFHIKNSMIQKPTIELYYKGNKVGYVESRQFCGKVVTDAEKTLAKMHMVGYKFSNDSFTYKIKFDVEDVKFVDENKFKTVLMNDANSYFTKGYGLYIDDTLVAIGKNREEVQAVLDETIKLYSELYTKVKTEDDIISFNSSLRIEEMSVPKNSVSFKDDIRKILGLDSLENLNEIFLTDTSIVSDITIEDISNAVPNISELTYSDISQGLPAENMDYSSNPSKFSDDENVDTSVSFKSSAVEVVREVIPSGEEIVFYDDKLLEGKKVLLKSGSYGIKEITYDVVYIDGVEITRTLVGEEIVKDPVNKEYKIGTKTQAQFDKEKEDAFARKRKRIAEEKKRKEEAERKAAEEAAAKAAQQQPSGEVVDDKTTFRDESGNYDESELLYKDSVLASTTTDGTQSSSGVATGVFLYPTKGTITSTFAGRTLFGEYEFHGALDIANKEGTPIYAADGGTVTYAAPLSTYGNCIRIEHGNGLETLYAHLSAYNIKKGDKVYKGQQIAEMGETGRATGPHLHFEVRVNGTRVDPMNYVTPPN